jgi:hypothetical protein
MLRFHFSISFYLKIGITWYLNELVVQNKAVVTEAIQFLGRYMSDD